MIVKYSLKLIFMDHDMGKDFNEKIAKLNLQYNDVVENDINKSLKTLEVIFNHPSESNFEKFVEGECSS